MVASVGELDQCHLGKRRGESAGVELAQLRLSLGVLGIRRLGYNLGQHMVR